MKTVVIYARISQDRAKDEAGVTRQVADCEALATRLDLDVLETIKDNDTSAYRIAKPRPGWERVKELATGGEIEGVVVWHTDRLYRHPMQLEELAAAIEYTGLTIFTCTSGELDLNTPSGRMAARMFGAAARQEVEHKAERQARKHSAIAAEGGWQGGRRPLGYMSDGVTVDEEKAPALRQAAQMILSGHSLADTSRFVSREWRRPVKPRVVSDVLTAPRIAGLRMHWPTADRLRVAKLGGDRQMQLTRAVWDGLISYEDWTAVRAILLDPRRRTNTRRPTKSLLGGFITCSLCGHSMGYSTSSYKCMRSVGGCGKVGISTKAIEAHILEQIEAVLSETTLGLVEMSSVAPPNPIRAKLQASYDELLPMWREREITRTEFNVQRALVQAQLEALDDADEEFIRRSAMERSVVTSLESWEEASTAARAQAIRVLMLSVVISPARAGRASGSKFDPFRVAIRWAGAAPQPVPLQRASI